MKHLQRPRRLIALGVLLGACNLSAHAQQTPAGKPQTSTVSSTQDSTEVLTEDQPVIADGSATHAWMQLQASGAQASKQKQTLSGPVMSRIYDRYLDSFSRPIPEWVSRWTR